MTRFAPAAPLSSHSISVRDDNPCIEPKSLAAISASVMSSSPFPSCQSTGLGSGPGPGPGIGSVPADPGPGPAITTKSPSIGTLFVSHGWDHPSRTNSSTISRSSGSSSRDQSSSGAWLQRRSTNDSGPLQGPHDSAAGCSGPDPWSEEYEDAASDLQRGRDPSITSSSGGDGSAGATVAAASGHAVATGGGGGGSGTALVVIDLQNDFLPGGSLAVPKGNEVVPVVNKIRRCCRDVLSLVAWTQDQHPAGHVSFAATHASGTPPAARPAPQQTEHGQLRYVRLKYDSSTGRLLDCSACGTDCPAADLSDVDGGGGAGASSSVASSTDENAGASADVKGLAGGGTGTTRPELGSVAAAPAGPLEHGGGTWSGSSQGAEQLQGRLLHVQGVEGRVEPSACGALRQGGGGSAFAAAASQGQGLAAVGTQTELCLLREFGWQQGVRVVAAAGGGAQGVDSTTGADAGSAAAAAAGAAAAAAGAAAAGAAAAGAAGAGHALLAARHSAGGPKAGARVSGSDGGGAAQHSQGGASSYRDALVGRKVSEGSWVAVGGATPASPASPASSALAAPSSGSSSPRAVSASADADAQSKVGLVEVVAPEPAPPSTPPSAQQRSQHQQPHKHQGLEHQEQHAQQDQQCALPRCFTKSRRPATATDLARTLSVDGAGAAAAGATAAGGYGACASDAGGSPARASGAAGLGEEQRQQQAQAVQQQQEHPRHDPHPHPDDEVVVLQRLWPEHCVCGTPGADLQADLLPMPDDVLVRKGTRKEVDGYSAFYDNGRLHDTGLHGALQAAGVRRLVVAGVATEYCVLYTVRDAVRLGYEVWLVSDAVRGLGGPEEAAALSEMSGLPGVLLVGAEQLISVAAAWPTVAARA